MQRLSLRRHIQVFPCRGLHLPARRRRTTQHLRTERPANPRLATNIARRNRSRIRGEGHASRGRGVRDPATGDACPGRRAMQRCSLRGHVCVIPCRGLHLPALWRRTPANLRPIVRAPPSLGAAAELCCRPNRALRRLCPIELPFRAKPAAAQREPPFGPGQRDHSGRDRRFEVTTAAGHPKRDITREPRERSRSGPGTRIAKSGKRRLGMPG